MRRLAQDWAECAAVHLDSGRFQQGLSPRRFTYRNGCSTFAHRRLALLPLRRRPRPAARRRPARWSAVGGAASGASSTRTRPGVHPDVRLHPEIPLLCSFARARPAQARTIGWRGRSDPANRAQAWSPRSSARRAAPPRSPTKRLTDSISLHPRGCRRAGSITDSGWARPRHRTARSGAAPKPDLLKDYLSKRIAVQGSSRPARWSR